MNFLSSVMFASRLLFPRTGKKSNARRSLFGACVCIGISLVPLVMVMTVSNSMIEGITERMIGLSTSNIQCSLFPASDFCESAESLKNFSERLRAVEGVGNVFPEIRGIGLAASSTSRMGASIRAVDKDVFERNKSFKKLFKIVSGKPDLSRKNFVIIGEKLADDLNLEAGSVMRLITSRKTSSGKTVPKITPLKVTAVVSSGYQELDAVWIFIPLEAGFSILPQPVENAVIGIETSDAFGLELDRIAERVELVAGEEGSVYKWNELNKSEYENFASTRVMLVFVMMLIVLVASVNISSALVMLVMERKKEIAIIKSLGGTSGGIAFSFVFSGLVTGFFGLLFGIPAGLFFSVNFYSIMGMIERFVNFCVTAFLSISPAFSNENIQSSSIHLLDPAFYLQSSDISIPLAQLLIISVGTVFLSLIVSLIPSIKAGKEKPIDTLRKI